jgi:hypothetical protein
MENMVFRNTDEQTVIIKLKSNEKFWNVVMSIVRLLARCKSRIWHFNHADLIRITYQKYPIMLLKHHRSRDSFQRRISNGRKQNDI